MISYWYVCDVNPVPWQMGPVSARPGKGGKGMYASVGRDEELYTYKEAIKEELRKQSPKKLEGHLGITCYFWRNRTVSIAQGSGRTIKKSEADGTNMLKATEDACQGILFDNDKTNKVGRFFVIDQGPEVQGRVIIRVEVLPKNWRDSVLGNLPDALYAEILATPEERFALELARPKNEVATEDDEYATGQDIF